ncbi:NfeD family protein [Demequina mangrovi]|uniref:Membrane protein implicated in regulation of membrane protease activity n=1 Tax=Demequina mangrovi TaxID=1043493 RepID=A0A1H7AWU6_9MICO|nr:NfeD family protein [Demequina mangrovi]SEJ69396.1 Membrane protein implicated in regulation of membrane protease activity [Demequina mangrovi]
MEQFLWWFIAAMVLGAVEIFTLDLLFIMLAGGAIAGGVAALLGAPWWLSVIIALAVAAALIGGLRPFLLRSLRAKGEGAASTNTAALVGREARAIDAVTETTGRVKLNGEVWSARTEDDAPAIPEGSDVTVLRIDGATAVVAPEKES